MNRAKFTATLALLFLCACTAAAPSQEPPPIDGFRTTAGAHVLGVRSFYVAGGQRDGPGAVGPRQIGVRIFYPAASSASGATARYADSALVDAMQAADYYDVPDDVIAGWADIVVPAYTDAPASSEQSWPLIIFGPGYGMSAVNYTVFAQDLASRGYAVAVIDSPTLGFMVGPNQEVWAAGEPDESQASGQALDMAADASIVATDLLARAELNLDPSRVAMMGHSLGGAAALEACRLDRRFRACINLDGHPFGPASELGFGAPTLVILNQPTPRGTPLGPPGLERAAMWSQIASRKETCAIFVTISEISHLSFADFYAVVPPEITAQLGALSGDDLYSAVSELSHAFLQDAFSNAPFDGVAQQVAVRDYTRMNDNGDCAAR